MKTQAKTLPFNKKIVGSGLRGYVLVSFGELKSVLGHPFGPSPDGKITAEWHIEVNGVVASIYDYKGDCPRSAKACEWHIGGHDNSALSLVHHLFPSARVREI